MTHTKLAIIFISIFIAQCHFIKKEEEPETSETTQDVPTTTTSPSTTTPTTTPTTPIAEVTNITNAGATPLILSPEQYSDMVHHAFSFRFGWEDDQGNFFDKVKKQLAVPLGGVDFIVSSQRDPSPKVQTQLVLRSLAWEAAGGIIWRDANPENLDKDIVFTHVTLNTDRPFQTSDQNLPASYQSDILEGEKRWLLQLEDLYWRTLSRPPLAAEISLQKNAFLAYMNTQDGWPPSGWTPVLYALLSSTEFWNL